MNIPIVNQAKQTHGCKINTKLNYADVYVRNVAKMTSIMLNENNIISI